MLRQGKDRGRFVSDHVSRSGMCAFKQVFLVSKRFKSTPFIGSVSLPSYLCFDLLGNNPKLQQHATDLFEVYGSGALQDYIIQFIAGLDPNFNSTLPSWPQYDPVQKSLLTMVDATPNITITSDTFREEAMALLSNLSLRFPA